MNIFAMHKDPTICAMWLDDKRVKHMPHETIEMLSMATERLTGEVLYPYREGQYNHPVSIWVRKELKNYYWTWKYLLALLDEYKYRELGGYVYGPTKMTTSELIEMINHTHPIPRIGDVISDCKGHSVIEYLHHTDIDDVYFRNSSKFKSIKDVITAYRKTMIHKWDNTDKVAPVWTKRERPTWSVNVEMFN